jgi:uncharacterized protein YndB with AHSA1/START domain
MPRPISASVQIAAPPEAVWAVVSDLTRMPEWSPELRWITTLGRPPVRVGSLLLGVNRRGLAVWPTTSRVVRLDPGRAVAWKTRESGATWTYELEPEDGGTRLTGSRGLPEFTLATRLMAPLIGGVAGHDDELAAGVATTLDRIRATVERARPVVG